MPIKMNDLGQTKPFSVIGFFLSEVGLGQTVRNIASSLFEVDFPINCINIDLPGRSNITDFSSHCIPWVPSVNNFLVCEMGTAVSLPEQIQQLGKGAREFLYPLWELVRLPYEVVEKLSFYDEIFAPSQFIADTFSQYTNRQVSVIHHPVDIPTRLMPNILVDGKLKIFSFFDSDSFISRKNPKAALDAFQIAFPKSINDVELTVKVRGSGEGGRRLLLEYALNDPRIKIIDKNLDRASMDDLIQGCNVFLSLHRSEGFGLGSAESLGRGKIVVSTNYGGTCDFINANTAYPVGYRLIPVKQTEYPFALNQIWADPYIDQAASYLQEIYADFAKAQNLALKGRELMIGQHSFKSVGDQMKSLFLERGYI